MPPDENREPSPGETLLSALMPEDENPNQPPADENQAPVPEGDENQPPPVEVKSLDTLLEKAGITAEDFYALELPTEAGVDPVTLGQAKDAAKAEADTAAKRAADELKLQVRENELLTKIRDAAALHELLPAEAKSPEVQQRLKEHQDMYLARERALLAEAIPDWADKQVAQAEQTAIVGLMRGYGFNDAEISNQADHRVVKMLRDYARIKQAIETAESKRSKPKSRKTQQREPTKSKFQRIQADLKAGKITQAEADTAVMLAGLERKS